MAKFGLTPQGFILKRLNDILIDQRQKAQEIFQDLVEPGEVVDVSDSSLLGRLISLDSPGDADLWEQAQMSWSALDPNSATGLSLDNIVAYTASQRFKEARSTASVLCSGNNGTLIPGGSVISAPSTNNEFSLIGSVALSPSLANSVTLSLQSVSNNTLYSVTYTTGLSGSSAINYTSTSSATVANILDGIAGIVNTAHPLLSALVVGETVVIKLVDVFQSSTFTTSSNIGITKVSKVGNAAAVDVGPIEQETNTITKIVTPVLGWDSVTNPLPATGGRFKETDEELRVRFRNTKLERSSNILDSLYSALNNIEGVEEVAVYENDTDIVDSNGVLGHSFMPVVLGGSSQLIAETIWRNKPLGIRSQGNTTVSITDSQGFVKPISFERPNPVSIYIKLDLSVVPESPTPFPSDGAAMIIEAIQSFARDNFGVGKDVIYSRLFTPINTVPGHQINSLFIGTSPNPAGMANIPIVFNALASFESVNIEIVIS